MKTLHQIRLELNESHLPVKHAKAVAVHGNDHNVEIHMKNGKKYQMSHYPTGKAILTKANAEKAAASIMSKKSFNIRHASAEVK